MIIFTTIKKKSVISISPHKNNIKINGKKMGIKKYLGQIGEGIANTKQLAMLTPLVQKIVSEFSRENIKDALEDDAKLNDLAETVYSKLPIGIKAKLSKEWFIKEMMSRKELLMSKKSNKKKLRKKKK